MSHSAPAVAGEAAPARVPDESGHFGVYGGRFTPEALMAALDELTVRRGREPAGRRRPDPQAGRTAAAAPPRYSSHPGRFGDRGGWAGNAKRRNTAVMF